MKECQEWSCAVTPTVRLLDQFLNYVSSMLNVHKNMDHREIEYGAMHHFCNQQD